MAAISTKISYAEDMGTEVVSIYVGEKRKRFVVHKDLLTSQSEYFDKALNGNFKEAEENAIYFKEDDPVAVGYLVTWLYRGVIPGALNGKWNSPNPFAQVVPKPTTDLNGPIPYPEVGSSLPFAYFHEREPNSRNEINVFVGIGHDAQYVRFSPEELRVADYGQGRKYGDGNPNLLRPLAAATSTVHNPTAHSSLFAHLTQQQTTRSTTTGTSLFGSVAPNVSQASAPSGSTSVLPTTLFAPGSPVLPPPFRPSQFGGIGGGNPTQQSTTQSTTTGTSLFGSVIPNVSQALARPGNTFIFAPGASVLPPPSRPSLFDGTGAKPARSVFTFNPSAKKPELRLGDFGYSSTIVYPPSDGKYIDGIPRSEPIGVIIEDEDAHQDALLHLCILAETILWPKLFNAAITAYTSGELNLLRNIPVHHVSTIYERTHSESKLREFVIDRLRCLINPAVACKDYMAMAQHEEFLESLLMRISITPATIVPAGSVFQMQQGTLRKVYHMDVGPIGTKFGDNRSGRKDHDEFYETEL